MTEYGLIEHPNERTSLKRTSQARNQRPYVDRVIDVEVNRKGLPHNVLPYCSRAEKARNADALWTLQEIPVCTRRVLPTA